MVQFEWDDTNIVLQEKKIHIHNNKAKIEKIMPDGNELESILNYMLSKEGLIKLFNIGFSTDTSADKITFMKKNNWEKFYLGDSESILFFQNIYNLLEVKEKQIIKNYDGKTPLRDINIIKVIMKTLFSKKSYSFNY